ncbi:hypothetical protein SLEP1_g59065 [Rubroshorea leprosula]|uniref:Uncharacterized protein n=1 Tax=Rubroshorea leprosula TaxID=152421 RepID=A0AAV5MSC5_9ROSI|nr:hypothetical protein SLEP1_g59065 [Rubroshorea leprosula]
MVLPILEVAVTVYGTVHRHCSCTDGQQLTGIKCLVWRCLVMWRLIEIALRLGVVMVTLLLNPWYSN